MQRLFFGFNCVLCSCLFVSLLFFKKCFWEKSSIFFWMFDNLVTFSVFLSQQTFVLDLKTSWRCLQHVFSVTTLRVPRRLEDVLQRRLGDVLKTSWRRLGRRKFVTLKTSWRHVLKTSWGHVLKTSWKHYGDKQNTYWGYLHLANLNVYLRNLYLTNLYLTILRRIQNALIRTQ